MGAEMQHIQTREGSGTLFQSDIKLLFNICQLFL